MEYENEEASINEMLKNIEASEIENIKSTLAAIYSVWFEIGIGKGQMKARVETTFSHIHSLVHDIYDEEVSLRSELKEKYRALSEETSRLAEKLTVPTTHLNDAPLLQRVKLLQQELDSLNKLREKRMQDLKQLRITEKKYCKSLEIEEFQLSSDEECPLLADLNKLESHVQMLSHEHTIRYDKYIRTQKEILSILNQVKISPQNPLENHIFSGAQPDSLSKNRLILIDEILEKVKKRKNEMEKQKNDLIEKLTVLWKRLNIDNKEFLSCYPDPKDAPLKYLQKEIERCEEIKKKNMESFINILRDELKDFWDKCGVSDSERQLFSSYLSAEASEDILSVHEEEVHKWKKHYEKVQPLLEKIQKRNKLWELLQAFDCKANEPDRWKNRGGTLLKEEKERNRLLKSFPVLENQIFQEIENYEKETGEEFFYKNENYKLLISKQWEERSNKKENLRIEKPFTPTNFASPRFGTRQTPTAKLKTPNTLTKSNTPRFPVYRTPLAKTKSAKKVIKKRELDFVRAVNALETDQVLKDVTSYSNFVKELNSSPRSNYRSSVLTSKKVAGTRVSMSSKNKSWSGQKSLRESLDEKDQGLSE